MWNLSLSCKQPKNLLQITYGTCTLFVFIALSTYDVCPCIFILCDQNCWLISLALGTGGSELKAVNLLCVYTGQFIELSAMTCGVLWLMPLLLEDKTNVVFQHEIAPPHIQYEVTTFWNKQLPELCFGWGGFTSWPLLSPALTLLDIFLWGFVKDEVYILPIPNPTWPQQMSTNGDCKTWT